MARVPDHKHLGLVFLPSLTFVKHINEKIKKAKKNMEIIKYLNSFLPFLTLKQMYNALVRSHLDYCDVIYHIPSKVHGNGNAGKNPIPRAALAVTGAWQGACQV